MTDSEHSDSERLLTTYPQPLLIGYALLLAVLCVIAFYGVVGLGFESDDRGYLADAEHVIDGTGSLFSTGRIFAGRPVVEVVFAATFALWGHSTFAYHIFAVVLHLCASLLTVRLLNTLGVSLRVSAVAGVLFAVGVSHYQVVHWVSGIAYSIYFGLGLLSIDTFIHYLRHQSLRLLMVSTGLLCLAVFTHASAIAFVPLAVFLIWYLRYDRKQMVLPVVVYAAGALFPFATILFFYRDAMTSHGAERVLELGRIGMSWMAYYGNVFLTSHTLLYPAPHYTDMLSVGMGVTALVLAGLALIWRLRLALLGFVFSAVLVTPFIATGFDRVQPRYLYGASFGAYLIGAWLIAGRAPLGAGPAQWMRICRGGVGLLVVGLSLIQLQTSLGVTHGRDARSLVSIEQQDEAVYHYFKGHEIAGHLNTTQDYVRLTKVALYNGITPEGVLLEAVAQRDEPILKALLGSAKFAFANVDSQISGAKLISGAINASDSPGKVAAAAAGGLYNAGSHFFNEKAYPQAARVFNNVVTLDPSRWDALHLKARAYLFHGSADSAVSTYSTMLDVADRDERYRTGLRSFLQEAVERESEHGPYWFLLSRAFALDGDMSNAIGAALLAIDKGPNLPKYWRSIILYSSTFVQQYPDRAPSQVLADVIEPSLSDRDSLLFVARLYRHLEDNAASRLYYQHILQLDPQNIEAQNALTEMN